MQRITTRGELIHQLAQAKKVVEDMEAAEQRAPLSHRSAKDRAQALALLQRARDFRDDLQAVLDAHADLTGETESEF